MLFQILKLHIFEKLCISKQIFKVASYQVVLFRVVVPSETNFRALKLGMKMLELSLIDL